jgi:hypothetical protein
MFLIRSNVVYFVRNKTRGFRAPAVTKWGGEHTAQEGRQSNYILILEEGESVDDISSE